MHINIMKMLLSFVFAWRGLLIVLKEENNAKVHLLSTIAALGVCYYLQVSPTDWAVICIVIGLVWITEIINTAVERFVDMVSPDFNPKAGVVKDIAAGAVLMAVIVAVVVGVFIFTKYLF